MFGTQLADWWLKTFQPRPAAHAGSAPQIKAADPTMTAMRLMLHPNVD
jgi:hypothetical protein